MQVVPTLALAFALLGSLSSCGCIEQVTLRPELSVTGVARAQAGTGAVEVIWKFKDCCPTGEQAAIALELQRSVAALWDRLVAGEIEVARYNELVRAAHDAITEVILICSAAEAGGATETDVAQAWSSCSTVTDRVAAAAR